eukprot:gb/GEZN01016990.1/.p1 GENE.gb/GEZN01016990.1/~~gb/GEZN01016990.1/.p1  ORF type:complete len:217 (+),score=27.89 gb/GEZN01016990.1/:98-652(+)
MSGKKASLLRQSVSTSCDFCRNQAEHKCLQCSGKKLFCGKCWAAKHAGNVELSYHQYSSVKRSIRKLKSSKSMQALTTHTNSEMDIADLDVSVLRDSEVEDMLQRKVGVSITSIKAPMEPEHEAFASFDRDGDGYISLKEFAVSLTDLGENLKDEEIKFLLDEFSKEKPGHLSYSEFIEMMSSR